MWYYMLWVMTINFPGYTKTMILNIISQYTSKLYLHIYKKLLTIFKRKYYTTSSIAFIKYAAVYTSDQWLLLLETRKKASWHQIDNQPTGFLISKFHGSLRIRVLSHAQTQFTFDHSGLITMKLIKENYLSLYTTVIMQYKLFHMCVMILNNKI